MSLPVGPPQAKLAGCSSPRGELPPAPPWWAERAALHPPLLAPGLLRFWAPGRQGASWRAGLRAWRRVPTREL